MQLIHMAIEQLNLQFKQQGAGMLLRTDGDHYYDVYPLDPDTHNTGRPMPKQSLVFGYTEEGINNFDTAAN